MHRPVNITLRAESTSEVGMFLNPWIRVACVTTICAGWALLTSVPACFDAHRRRDGSAASAPVACSPPACSWGRSSRHGRGIPAPRGTGHRDVDGGHIAHIAAGDSGCARGHRRCSGTEGGAGGHDDHDGRHTAHRGISGGDTPMAGHNRQGHNTDPHTNTRAQFGILAGGVRWRDLRLRRCPVLRVDGRNTAVYAGRRHGRNPVTQGLLGGGVRRWDLRLRFRPVLRLDRWPAAQPARRRHGRHAHRRRVLAGGVRRWDLRLRHRAVPRLDRGTSS